MDSDNMNVPADGASAHGGPDAHGREKHGHEALPAMDQIGSEHDGAHAEEDADGMNIEVPGEAEFLDDPGTGFGFADADELAAEQDAEAGSAPELTPEEAAALEAEEAEARADAEEAAAAYARASMMAFETPAEPVETEADDPLVAHRGEKPKQLVIVNDVPGDETRIAILEQGKLVQFFSERAATSTNVGSIYKARVVNVEPAIQAAFVDFGEGANGFLHISDLHPKYFPANRGDSEKSVERVGKKVPRRARPLIQDALKRGMEITVQVLKEGLGSKGPTVTSYLSIPGRLLVMMPDMDNVGVSRKVDDEDSRRKMRKILDSLNLPEGFGFILRTAGFDATRTELARDAQYLTRLWSVMAKRMDAVGAPCQLYTEGDILLRTIRDSIDVTVDGIVCDSESSFHRAKAFLEVVSPRTATKVHFWDRRMPIFHAFDVERQVDMIHAREVPLPSGGALVIDQAEALVAIDVNSGRSRSARDSETNAYQTNQEAVDEIARQLRLRDLGGVIVNDLIDMRSVKHRREIEDRLKKHFQKDRAKTTVSQISEFGIVEMTRQRMRPSLRKTHYMECPHCQGLGEIRMPDTVAADAIRRIQFTLDMQQVARIDVVCSAKVAAVLLSKKRRTLVELEDLFGKKIAVRISDAIAVDRVDLYAYDDRNADVELDRPQKPQIPSLSSLPTEIEEDEAPSSTEQRGEGGGRRRRRRRRKPAAADATSMILSGGFEDLPDLVEDEPSISEAIDAEEEAERAAAEAAEREADTNDEDGDEDGDGEVGTSSGRRDDARDGEGGGRRRRRRRRGRGGRDRDGEHRDGERRDGNRAPAAAPAPVAPPPPPREPSEPIRVHAIAKEMELTSKEVLAKCEELGIEVKGHQSLLSGEQGDELRKAYRKPPFDVPEPAPEPTPELSAAGEGSEQGEGGRRRKRRRRRRGRGGRGIEGGEGGPDGAHQSSDEAEGSDADESDEQSDSESDDRSRDAEDRADEGDSTEDGDDSADGGESDGESGDEPTETSGESGSGDGDRGGRRKRRRRRGGRGRRREGESGGGGGGNREGNRDGNRDGNRGGDRGGNRGNDRRDNNRDRNRGNDRRDNRGENRGNNRDSGQRSEPKPTAPAPAPAPAAAPKPRSLYGGRVRKLAPGERPKGGGDD